MRTIHTIQAITHFTHSPHRYFFSKLNIAGFVPTVLYFAYMLMISVTFSLLTGAVGFFSCLWFVKKIYGAIKVD